METGWIVIVILIWVVSSISKAAKMKQQNQAKQQQARSAASGPANAPRQTGRQETRSSGSHRVNPEPARPLSQPRPEAGHSFVPLETHMHTPVMGVEGEGTEGIDCCHEYMLDDSAVQPLPDELSFLREEEGGEKAGALLQGVIFSEILGRRPVRRYGGRRA